ncbi:MAG: hypothetical protein PVJ89_05275 [Planctomycetota bacterium]|jgi:adenosylhomocysteine nucleosidase
MSAPDAAPDLPRRSSEAVLTGVVAALPAELGPLLDGSGGAEGGTARRGGRADRSRLGTRIHEVDAWEGDAEGAEEGGRIVAAISGVGKVAAARAAAALVAEGATRLLVVGTCGGLGPSEEVGQLVHARRAVQWDLAVREGREFEADGALLEAWRAVAGGSEGTFLTADRPAIRLRDRVRRARAAAGRHPGPAVADMEVAAVAAVASQAGIPWAALKVVSDARPTLLATLRGAGGGLRAFEEALRAHGGRPAATVPALCRALTERSQ